MKICSGGDKMRNASGHQCKLKMTGSEKSEREHIRHSLHKECNLGGVYMTPGRERVHSCSPQGSIFVYMIPPQISY